MKEKTDCDDESHGEELEELSGGLGKLELVGMVNLDGWKGRSDLEDDHEDPAVNDGVMNGHESRERSREDRG